MIGRFLLVGGGGFAIDMIATLLLIRAGVAPLYARPPAILLAMTFTWLANRAFTFQVAQQKTLAEALRYGAVALLGSLLNFLIYSALLQLGSAPAAAIAVASLIQSVASYMGYRRFAFRLPSKEQP